MLLIEQGAVPGGRAVDGEGGNLKRQVGDLEARRSSSTNETQPHLFNYKPGNLRQCIPLPGIAVERLVGRILHADAVAGELTNSEKVDGTGAASVLRGRLYPVVGPCHHRRFGTGIGRPRPYPNVDHAGRCQAILSRQRAGKARQCVREARTEYLREGRESLRQLNAVEPVLEFAVAAAHMDAAQAIVCHALPAEQHLTERSILPLGYVLNVLARETVPRSPQGPAGSRPDPGREGWP